ncbi:MAG: alkaline phosphatase family protein [Sulfuricella sp.]
MQRISVLVMVVIAALLSACGGGSSTVLSGAQPAPSHKVIVFVWDGLRPDSVNAVNTPNLAALRDSQGVNFTDNHSVFPTFTMMNASAFATGSYPGTHGFYGNTLYQPDTAGKTASNKDSAGNPISFQAPIFTEDYGIVNALNTLYANKLYLVGTLFQAAHAAGLKTAAVGKSGAAFIQDYADYAADTQNGNGKGVILDEKFAFPLSFAKNLQAAGYNLPKLTPVNYGTGITLAANNGDPTAATASAFVRLADKTTTDPRSTNGSPFNAANEYMMDVFLNYILPKVSPDLSLVWFRNPDSTEHIYGPGTAPYLAALASQDKMLGLLMAKIKELGIQDRTNIIIVSDHGHTTVAGDPSYFPPRALGGAADGSGTVGAVDVNGYSVSGDTRTADLLSNAGIANVYDGTGCVYDPVLSGIKTNGTNNYPDLIDTTGAVCGKVGQVYSSKSYKIPATLPINATIIAANGGSDYIYLPDHDSVRLATIVKALQSRKQYGAIFVASNYGAVPPPGTLPMSLIKVESNSTSLRNPDIIVSFDYDNNAVTAGNVGLPGTEYESFFNLRGMHGSFGRRDVLNSLFAAGPDFNVAYTDVCPTGNVDVAPTAAYILGLTLPQADGRPLLEALKGSGKSCASTDFTAKSVASSQVTALAILNPDDPTGASVDAAKSTYQFTLSTKELNAPNGKLYTYFDEAKAVRN